MSAQRNKVKTYLGPRAFYKKDMENKHRVGQTDQQLPPRCTHCRVSWDITMVDDTPHCQNHIALGRCTADCDTAEDSIIEGIAPNTDV